MCCGDTKESTDCKDEAVKYAGKDGIVFAICDKKLKHYNYEEHYSTSGNPSQCKEIIIHDIVKPVDLHLVRIKKNIKKNVRENE